MKIAQEEVWDTVPVMASLIAVQCGTVQELTAHAPVEKRVLAVQKRAHEELEEVVHVTRHQCRKECLRTRRLHMKGHQTLGRRCRDSLECSVLQWRS